MTKQVRVRVDWVPPTEGGRAVPPGAGRYVSVAGFDGADGSDGSWSVVLDLDGPPDARGSSMADARFLVEDAPHDRLRPGARFELYEGMRCVASAEVVALSEDHAVPNRGVRA